MKTKSITLWVAAIAAIMVLLGPLAGQSRGDFVLLNDDQLTVDSAHYKGTLYDTSCVSIVFGGAVSYLYTYDYSNVNMSSGSVSYLSAHNSSTVDISGGSVSDHLQAFDSSTVNISGGIVRDLRSLESGTLNITGGSVSDHLQAFDSSTVNISGGIVRDLRSLESGTLNISGGSASDYLHAYDYSIVNISGGMVRDLRSCDSSTVDISGGSLSDLWAIRSSMVTFHGRNFSVSDGLILYGDRVLGTGKLSGEWMDGTPWIVNILSNYTTATIRVIPEPATLLLLGLGVTIISGLRRDH